MNEGALLSQQVIRERFSAVAIVQTHLKEQAKKKTGRAFTQEKGDQRAGVGSKQGLFGKPQGAKVTPVQCARVGAVRK